MPARTKVSRCCTARLISRSGCLAGCGKKAKDIWLGNVTFRGVRTSDLHARSRSTSVRYVQLHFGRRARSRESSAAPDPPHGGCGVAGDVAQLFAAVRQTRTPLDSARAALARVTAAGIVQHPQ